MRCSNGVLAATALPGGKHAVLRSDLRSARMNVSNRWGGYAVVACRKPSMDIMDESKELATLVIQHHVKPESRSDYEGWVKKIAQEAQRFQGHLGVNVIRPHGTSNSYTIVLRFDSHQHMMGWVESATRKRLVQEAQPLLSDSEDLELQTGLEYWFTPPASGQAHAKPYKQFLVTLSAIFPLTVVVPALLRPVFGLLGLLEHPIFSQFTVVVVIVALMVYLIMPRYTRAVAGWLFK